MRISNLSFGFIEVVFSICAGAYLGFICLSKSGKSHHSSIRSNHAVIRLYRSYVQEASPHVDWDRLRDEFLLACLDDDDHHHNDKGRRLRRNRLPVGPYEFPPPNEDVTTITTSDAATNRPMGYKDLYQQTVSDVLGAARDTVPAATTKSGQEDGELLMKDDGSIALDDEPRTRTSELSYTEAYQQAVSEALEAARSVAPIIIQDPENEEDPPGDGTGQSLDDALVGLDEILAQAEEAQLLKISNSTTNGDDDSPGADDDLITSDPTESPQDDVSGQPSEIMNGSTSEIPSESAREPSDGEEPTPSPSREGMDGGVDDDQTPTDSPTEPRNSPSRSPATSPGDGTTPGDGDGTGSGTDDGIPIPSYRYSPGTDCGNTDQRVPCAPSDLRDLCVKGGSGKFSECLDACIPSFCCIHEAPPTTNTFAPNCNQEPNCAEYAPCYIVWWKLSDTIGPATQLRLEQNDDFFDVTANDIQSDQTNNEFFREFLFHYFENSQDIVAAGTVNGQFDSDRIFLNPDFWETQSVLP